MYESLGLLAIIVLVAWRRSQKRQGMDKVVAGEAHVPRSDGDDEPEDGVENEEEAQACLAVGVGLSLYLDGPVHRLQCSEV